MIKARLACFLMVAGGAGIAAAQVPDVRFKVDAALVYRAEQHGSNSLRLYDTLGHASTLGLILYLEPGLRAYFSQRLEHIGGNADRDSFDEYYVEDEGIWRVGKQYLPFGSGAILRESVLAARGDTNLILENLPLSIAFCDGGDGAQRGMVGRFGQRIGVSFAFGNDFGIAGTSLTGWRRPEDSPGLHRGWQQAVGIDAARRIGSVSCAAEVVSLSRGETSADADLILYDASFKFELPKRSYVTVGLTRTSPDRTETIRLLGSVRCGANVWFEPMVRVRDSQLYDLSFGLRVKI